MSLVIALTGFPGTGKLTVARSIAAEVERSGGVAVVVDNHSINNPIFGLIDQDGITPLPSEVWDRVGDVTRAVFKTVETLTPHDWDVVFTAYLDGVTDTGWLPALARIAEQRGATLVPVRLLCDPTEIARRIVEPERRAQMKSIDPDLPYRLAEAGSPHDSGMPNSLTIDVTRLPPLDAARAILQHARSITWAAPSGTSNAPDMTGSGTT
ncbi:MAG: AAA family ATPase [Actinomycetota bacterium]